MTHINGVNKGLCSLASKALPYTPYVVQMERRGLTQFIYVSHHGHVFIETGPKMYPQNRYCLCFIVSNQRTRKTLNLVFQSKRGRFSFNILFKYQLFYFTYDATLFWKTKLDPKATADTSTKLLGKTKYAKIVTYT